MKKTIFNKIPKQHGRWRMGFGSMVIPNNAITSLVYNEWRILKPKLSIQYYN